MAHSANAAYTSSGQRPNWLQDTVLYEVNVRAFSREGSFDGVTRRLDHLADLGISAIWLMPVHPIGQRGKKGTLGSPYAPRDFYAVNPELGSSRDLRNLVDSAHERGIKVLQDVVVAHTAWDSILIESRPDFYKKNKSWRHRLAVS